MPLIPLALQLAGLLPTLAPIVGSWFGGAKGEAVAAKVVGIAQAVTGTATPDAALAALQASPDAALAYEKAIIEQKVELQQLAFQTEQLVVTQDQNVLADKQNAREMDMTYVKAGRSNSRATAMLLVTFLGLVASVAAMIYYHVDANTAIGGVLIMLVGKLVSMWGTAFDFEFGSSRSSRDKDDTIAQQAVNAIKAP